MPNPGKGNGHFLLARQTELHPSHPFWPSCICNVSTSHHTLSLLASPLVATGRERNPLPLHRTHFRLASLDASLRRVALYDCMPTRRFAITGRKGEELTNERRDERTSGALSILHFFASGAATELAMSLCQKTNVVVDDTAEQRNDGNFLPWLPLPLLAAKL